MISEEVVHLYKLSLKLPSKIQWLYLIGNRQKSN